jgi:hypothetical protein
MIEPTDADIGRKVVYRAWNSWYRNDVKPEEGVITSFNAAYVFVRYGASTTSKATRRADLEWMS